MKKLELKKGLCVFSWLFISLLAANGASDCAKELTSPCAMPNGAGLGLWLEKENDPDGGAQMLLRNARILFHGDVYNYGLRAIYAPIEKERLSAPESGMVGLGRISLWGAVKSQCSENADHFKRIYTITGESDPAAFEWLSDVLCENIAPPEKLTLNVTVSRLTPAVLIELVNARGVRLFAGDKTARWLRIDPPPVPLAGRPGPPKFYAWKNESELTFGKIEAGQPHAPDLLSLKGSAAGAWLLLWYGAESWFMGGPSSMTFYSRQSETQLMPGDAPMLLLFSDVPDIRLDQPGGSTECISLFFEQAGARILLIPLYGYRILDARATSAWGKTAGLPAEVIKRCQWWTEHSSAYPLVVANEEPAYDQTAHKTRFTYAFEFKPLWPGTAYAPVPPMLELARRAGLPITISVPLSDSELATYCGPYVVAETDVGYAVEIEGLDKYVLQSPAPMGNLKSVPDRLLRKLEHEVDEILAAGHLAPYHLPIRTAWNWPWWSASNRLLYSEPGRTLESLARTLPWLDAARQKAVLAYLRQERLAYPPETVPHLPDETGARRERGKSASRLWDPAFAQSNWSSRRERTWFNFHHSNNCVPAEGLYGLSEYYCAVGAEAMREEGFDLTNAAKKTVLPFIARRDWATLGWYSWPAKKRGQWDSYGYNYVHDANRQIAALIGFTRLAAMQGDDFIFNTGMALAVEAFVHRFALGKYGRWLYTQPDIMYQPEGLNTNDDFRAPVMTEGYAILDYGRSPLENADSFLAPACEVEGPYACMVPELGRFVADQLRDEAEAFIRWWDLYRPASMLTMGYPRRTMEWYYNRPEDVRQFFLVRAWCLGWRGEDLFRLVDVPLVPLGDWHYLDRLTAALEATCGVEWKQFDKAIVVSEQ